MHIYNPADMSYDEMARRLDELLTEISMLEADFLAAVSKSTAERRLAYRLCVLEGELSDIEARMPSDMLPVIVGVAA